MNTQTDTVDTKMQGEINKAIGELTEGAMDTIGTVTFGLAIARGFIKNVKGKFPIQEIVDIVKNDIADELKPVGDFLWGAYSNSARRKCQLFVDLKKEFNLSDEVTFKLMKLNTVKLKLTPSDKTEKLKGQISGSFDDLKAKLAKRSTSA